MDPVNERMVFDLVVKTACNGNTSQYFLLTPKLLPDLEYSERLTVLAVHNGRQSTFAGNWSIGEFTRHRRALTETDWYWYFIGRHMSHCDCWLCVNLTLHCGDIEDWSGLWLAFKISRLNRNWMSWLLHSTHDVQCWRLYTELFHVPCYTTCLTTSKSCRCDTHHIWGLLGKCVKEWFCWNYSWHVNTWSCDPTCLSAS